MKYVAVTTTINIPTIAHLFDRGWDEMFFIVIGDVKTDDDMVRAALKGLSHRYYSVADQEDLGYRCTDLIGLNSIQKRNIGFLEALKLGATAVYSFDDDNAPLSLDHFNHFHRVIGQPFSGLQIGAPGEWFDVGALQYMRGGDSVRQRGFPLGRRSSQDVGAVVAARVGVAQGICLGDPDTSAVDRASQAPRIDQVSELLRVGIVANPYSWAIFNSQNTMVVRELIPAWGMVPHCGRYDDICASLICQRVARERGLFVHFGQPFVWQQRNQHNLVKDLRGELDGMESVELLALALDSIVLKGRSVIGDCRTIWETLNHATWMPGRSVSAMMAYLDDCEQVLNHQKAVA